MSIPALIICLVILSAVILTFLFGGKLPRPYRSRRCQGRGWRSAFPNAAKNEIRDFLSDFVDSFAIDNKEQLKLNPEDKLLDIYKALNPYEWGGDALEFETLAVNLEEKYGVNFESIWNDKLTLGELFSIARKIY